jgi:TRAP transporter TAXI family solute receptor
MKKQICVLIAVVIATFGMISAAKAQEQVVTVATGPLGGTFYPLGKAMVEIWSDNIAEEQFTFMPSAGTRNNIQLLIDSEAEVAFAEGLYVDAFYGLNAYDGNPHSFMRALTPLYQWLVYLVVNKNSGIKTVDDLKGKRISLGAIGNSASSAMGAIMRLTGIDIEKDVDVVYLSYVDQVSALTKHSIDVALFTDAPGSAGVEKLLGAGCCSLLAVPNSIIEAAVQQVPYLSKYSIPPNAFPGQTAVVTTFSTPAVMLVHEKIHPILVYRMTKALYENQKDLVAVADVMKGMEASDILKVKIPIHPGAERYYNEINVIE